MPKKLNSRRAEIISKKTVTDKLCERFPLLLPVQVFRDAVVCHYLHHRVLLLDVRRDLVCHAHLRLAHVLQGPGHHSPAAVWQNLLLPHGHVVHPLRPHCGHPGYR